VPMDEGEDSSFIGHRWRGCPAKMSRDSRRGRRSSCCAEEDRAAVGRLIRCFVELGRDKEEGMPADISGPHVRGSEGWCVR
jgi:hypothetical protein